MDSQESKKRVFWNHDEKVAIGNRMAVLAHGIEKPNLLELAREAQLMLPEDRRREILAWSIVKPTLESHFLDARNILAAIQTADIGRAEGFDDQKKVDEPAAVDVPAMVGAIEVTEAATQVEAVAQPVEAAAEVKTVSVADEKVAPESASETAKPLDGLNFMEVADQPQGDDREVATVLTRSLEILDSSYEVDQAGEPHVVESSGSQEDDVLAASAKGDVCSRAEVVDLIHLAVSNSVNKAAKPAPEPKLTAQGLDQKLIEMIQSEIKREVASRVAAEVASYMTSQISAQVKSQVDAALRQIDFAALAQGEPLESPAQSHGGESKKVLLAGLSKDDAARLRNRSGTNYDFHHWKTTDPQTRLSSLAKSCSIAVFSESLGDEAEDFLRANNLQVIRHSGSLTRVMDALEAMA